MAVLPVYQPTRHPSVGAVRRVLPVHLVGFTVLVLFGKQVMDFLGQLVAAGPGFPLAESARTAIDSIRRGVVAVTIAE